jgi:predicted nucleotidyltransferase
MMASSNPPVPAFDPLRALRVLLKHRVQFVLIGGFSARLHGSPSVTNDVDICYASDPSNLEALAAALAELRARLRGTPEDVPFLLDARTLRMGDKFTFVTDAGNLDCLGTPAGVSGFGDLDRSAVTMDLDGLTVLVSSIEDLIRMKQAAGRPKDLIEAEVLGALRDEIDRKGRERQRRKPPRA